METSTSRFFLKAKSIARKFAEQTSIDGFAEILHSVHLLEALTWVGLLLFCFYLTARDCEGPIRSYIQEDVYSVVELTRNDTIEFPGAIACVEIGSELLPAENKTRLIDPASLEVFRSCLVSPSCYRAFDFYDRFYDEIVAASKLLWSYVAVENDEKNQISLSKSVASTVPTTFHLFLQNISDVASLQQVLAYAFCTRMEIQTVYFEKENDKKRGFTQTNFCDTAQPTWFGPPLSKADTDVQLCFAVGKLAHFLGAKRTQVISFFPQNIYPQQDKIVYEETSIEAFFNPADEPATTDRSAKYATARLRGCESVNLEVVARVTSLQKRRSPCSPIYSAIECVSFCVIDALAEHCNCSSISYDLRGPSAKSCFSVLPPSEFEACGKEALHLALACRKRCRRHSNRCSTTRILLEQETCSVNAYRSESTTIELHVKQYEYLTYEERFTMDLSTLMSNLGGIFGLWLGAGFIGIIQALTFPLKICSQRLLVRERSFEVGDDGLSLGEEVAILKAKYAALEKKIQQNAIMSIN